MCQLIPRLKIGRVNQEDNTEMLKKAAELFRIPSKKSAVCLLTMVIAWWETQHITITLPLHYNPCAMMWTIPAGCCFR